MITAVDTNVLLDVFLADKSHGARSAAALRTCLGEGRLVVADAVWAEVCSVFPDSAKATAAMDELGLFYEPLDKTAATRAGNLWRKYRQAGGSRSRMVADFLVGAHALEHADRLLSRDRGFYRRYFKGLTVLDPSRD
ncbi:MAG: type II toxin-antitoxin system VapC family toxin [Deltaproteobacteria bacterium]|nr:type II toxin-antitoxin system VapC family toxin [Deltaproteobacteria bacterium]